MQHDIADIARDFDRIRHLNDMIRDQIDSDTDDEEKIDRINTLSLAIDNFIQQTSVCKPQVT